MGRISKGVDVATGEECIDGKGSGRSFENGVGLPIALFVRDANYRSLVGLLRTRSRFSHIFGRDVARGMPLLYITPETGVRVLTESLQKQLLKTMAWDLNPFQNAYLAHHCGVDNTSETHLRQKLEELLDLDDDNLKQVLTPEEMARIAGWFDCIPFLKMVFISSSNINQCNHRRIWCHRRERSSASSSSFATRYS